MCKSKSVRLETLLYGNQRQWCHGNQAAATNSEAVMEERQASGDGENFRIYIELHVTSKARWTKSL